MQLRNCIKLSAVAGLQFLNAKENVYIPDKKGKLNEAIRKSSQLITAFKEEHGLPGIVVGVSVNGDKMWSEGFGYSDVETLSPCSKDTVMRIASISKPLTMALVAKLWEEGKLDMNAPIQKYVKEFPEKTFEGEPVIITTKQLVSHLGGIRHYKRITKQPVTQSEDSKKGVTEKTEKEVVEKDENSAQKEVPEFYETKQFDSVIQSLDIFKNDDLLSKPGTKFRYTTYGWTLVSAICEGAGGMAFEKQMKAMFRQFGMHKTSLDYNRPIVVNRAKYYHRTNRHRLENVPEVNNSSKWAGGGILSTVDDLLLFAHVMLYSRECGVKSTDAACCPLPSYLTANTIAQLWSRIVTRVTLNGTSCYGMGFAVKPEMEKIGPPNLPWNRSEAVGHSGGGIGASSMLFIKPGTRADGCPPKGVCVAILTNMQSVNLNELALKIIDEFECLE